RSAEASAMVSALSGFLACSKAPVRSAVEIVHQRGIAGDSDERGGEGGDFVVVDESGESLRILGQLGGLGTLPHERIDVGSHLRPHRLDLTQEDMRSRRTDAGEFLEQRGQTGRVRLALVSETAQIAGPAVDEQGCGIIEARRSALVVASVAAAAEGVDPL